LADIGLAQAGFTSSFVLSLACSCGLGSSLLNMCSLCVPALGANSHLEEALFGVMAKVIESKTNHTSTFEVFAYVMFTNIPLARTSYMAKPNIKGSSGRNCKRK